ncbi:alpha/beta hydrolase [Agrilactobacillus fermenti]|uniref:alpha/beta hydrolase n=1 Tax=Agrilactobacillus fermenti TaxID=2586909 RepID=UPI001E32B62B|nr:alpha/beta hydrolase [Agrilactobacillus fermenti]MCD2256837.1 alpha/beta hydrolase [Agrilactobacillus fermenti]
MHRKFPQNYRWIIGALLLIALFLGLAIPGYHWMQQNVKYARVIHNSRVSPIIFIPGSSATQDRFDDLINQLNANNRNHSLVKITVHTNGKLQVTGKVSPRDNQPFFVVGFENNKDGYSNIKKQAAWFDQAMDYLVDRYHFNNFSGIGHSNGGLIYTLYLEKYFDSDDLSMRTLMTIGTPYNFSEKNPANRTQMLSDFITDKKKIPTDLTVYSIAGTEDYNDDGIVPFQSVEAGKFIYQDQAKHYTEITVTGSNSQHSDLPTNQQIVRLIEQYVLDDNGNNRNGTPNARNRN